MFKCFKKNVNLINERLFYSNNKKKTDLKTKRKRKIKYFIN